MLLRWPLNSNYLHFDRISLISTFNKHTPGSVHSPIDALPGSTKGLLMGHFLSGSCTSLKFWSQEKFYYSNIYHDATVILQSKSLIGGCDGTLAKRLLKWMRNSARRKLQYLAMIIEWMRFATENVIETILNPFGAGIQNPGPLAQR